MTPYLFTSFYYSLYIESSAITDYHTHYLKVPEMAHAIVCFGNPVLCTVSQKETLALSCFLCFTAFGRKNKATRFTGGRLHLQSLIRVAFAEQSKKARPVIALSYNTGKVGDQGIRYINISSPERIPQKEKRCCGQNHPMSQFRSAGFF